MGSSWVSASTLGSITPTSIILSDKDNSETGSYKCRLGVTDGNNNSYDTFSLTIKTNNIINSFH